MDLCEMIIERQENCGVKITDEVLPNTLALKATENILRSTVHTGRKCEDEKCSGRFQHCIEGV